MYTPARPALKSSAMPTKGQLAPCPMRTGKATEISLYGPRSPSRCSTAAMLTSVRPGTTSASRIPVCGNSRRAGAAGTKNVANMVLASRTTTGRGTARFWIVIALAAAGGANATVATRLQLLRREPHRHRFDAVDEVRAQPAHRPRQLDVGQPGEQLLEHDVNPEPGEIRAEAEVLADAERQMVVGRAADIETVGIGEDVFVAVRGDVPEDDLVSFADLPAAHLDVLCGGAAEVHHRPHHAQHT